MLIGDVVDLGLRFQIGSVRVFLFNWNIWVIQFLVGDIGIGSVIIRYKNNDGIFVKFFIFQCLYYLFNINIYMVDYGCVDCYFFGLFLLFGFRKGILVWYVVGFLGQ